MLGREMRILSFTLPSLLIAASLNAPASADARYPRCLPGPFYMFFQWDSSDIADDGIAVLEQVIAARVWCGPNVKVVIDGHADRSQDHRMSKRISIARAMAVAKLLHDNGILNDVIRTTGFAERKPRILTENGVRVFQNRRVEIRFVLPEKN